MTQQPPKPFDCEYSPQFAQLLHNLGISLAISTYQAGKVVMVSSVDEDRLVQLPRTFPGAMGMAAAPDTLAVACRSEVVVLRNEPLLASTYPTKPHVYDAMYLPRATYHTGSLALHDMEYVDGKLVAVNTMFSCLSYIDDRRNFTSFWQPPFISALKPEDRCHMNGMAVADGQIRYLTALGHSNEPNGWRDNKMSGGILMEYPTGNIILEGLSMPHSPRLYNGKLYLLNSAQGELIEVDVANQRYEVVVKLGGFARGMALCGDYLFIGVSKLRHNSKTFSDLPIAKTSFAGVIAVYLPYKSIVGSMKYVMSVDEIYDVKVIPAMRPSLLSTDMEIQQRAYCLGDGAFWAAGDGDGNNQAAQVQEKTEAQSYRAELLKAITPAELKRRHASLLSDSFSEMIDKAAFSGNLVAVVARCGDVPAGMAVVEVFADRKAQKHSLVVLPAHQGRGVELFLQRQLDILTERNQLVWL